MLPSPEKGGLIVFLRLPIWGKVKTRLAASVGHDSALEIYQQLTSITLDMANKSGHPVFLFFEGGLPDPGSRQDSFSYHLQSQGSLGDKMANAFTTVLKSYSKAVIIGSDCPELTIYLVNESFRLLDSNDLVFGPALDGGYYLLGCKKMVSSLFENIDWSTSSVMDQTLHKINELGLSYALLPALSDIDTEGDWSNYLQKDINRQDQRRP